MPNASEPPEQTPNPAGAEQSGHVSEISAAGSTGEWESCEIVYHHHPMQVNYSAQASGPLGPYIAAVSRSVLAHEHEHGPVVNELIQKLLADGWGVSNSSGPYWFSYRFQRLARPPFVDPQGTQPPHTVGVSSTPTSFNAPRTLSEFVPFARSWVIKKVAQGDEEAFNKAASAIKHAVRAVTEMAAPTLGRSSALPVPLDPALNKGSATGVGQSPPSQGTSANRSQYVACLASTVVHQAPQIILNVLQNPRAATQAGLHHVSGRMAGAG